MVVSGIIFTTVNRHMTFCRLKFKEPIWLISIKILVNLVICHPFFYLQTMNLSLWHYGDLQIGLFTMPMLLLTGLIQKTMSYLVPRKQDLSLKPVFFAALCIKCWEICMGVFLLY